MQMRTNENNFRWSAEMVEDLVEYWHQYKTETTS